MKELHTHIFSNTSCISKEIMLKHINNQLSKKELYEIEKHMLDCELCSDAFEGMKYAKNSSMLFFIDNTINKNAGFVNAKSPLIRNLMLAASILVLVFASYFTITFFNKTINKDVGLAVNNVTEKKSASSNEEKISDNELADSTDEETEEFVPPPPPELETIGVVEDLIEMPEDFVAEYVEYEEEAYEEISVSDNRSISMDLEDNINDVSLEEDEEIMMELSAKSASKKHKRKEMSSPNIYKNAKPKVSSAKVSNSHRKDLLMIDGFKAVNYLNEYQQSHNVAQDMKYESSSLSSGFERKLNESIAENEKQASIVEITYQETLENAIRLYKNKKYKEANIQFDNILAKHSKEANAQFYSGLCYYHLKRNKSALNMFNAVLKNKEKAFDDDAKWYKSLTLIRMKDITSAKKVLKQISKNNGFYKTEATNKLKKLN